MPSRRILSMIVVAFLLVVGSGGGVAAGNPSAATQGPKPPANSSLPTISGKPIVGQALTGSPGRWTGPPSTYTYQWERCDLNGLNCNPITTATATTYLLAPSD